MSSRASLIRRLRLGAATAAAIAATSVVATTSTGQPGGPTPGSHAAVAALVAAASTITKLPSDLTPSLAAVASDFASPVLYNAGCEPSESQTSVPACAFGDLDATHTIVVYGDSHAEMWFDAFQAIADRIGWRLVMLAKPYCPATEVTFTSPIASGPYTQCTAWQRFAVARIRRLHPSVVVVTGEFEDATIPSTRRGAGSPAAQWEAGEEKTLELLRAPGTEEVVLGNIVDLDTAEPTCLARHPDAIQACGMSLDKAESNWIPFFDAEEVAARAEGARYVNVVPWLCGTDCSPVIGQFNVYFNEFHITATYASYLSQVLHEALEPSIKASA